MKNRFKLYKITLKKLSIPAAIMGALLVISTVLYLNGKMRETQNYGYAAFFRGKPTAFGMAPGLPVFMILGAAVLTYMAFSYLNKRSASDFYHALPYTRAENLLVRVGAVLTYQVGIILLTLLTSFLVLTGKGIAFNFSFYPLLFCGYAAGSLLVAGAVLVAMSVTGTAAGNVLVSGLILFLPRMILFILGQSVISMTGQRILLAHTGIFLNPAYNIVTGSLLDISRLWEYYGLSETLINPGSIVYTAALGAVYFGLAVWLMKKRKSELAGNGAISAAWGCIFGALASLPILLVGIYTYMDNISTNMSYQSIMMILIIFAIALVVYLVVSYMLSTRWKAVLKSLPLFAAAIVIAFGVMFGANVAAEELGTKLPAKDKIAYVRIDEEPNWSSRYNASRNYNTLLAKEVTFTDPKVIERFHDVLEQNNEDWQMRRDGIYTDYTPTTTVLCEYTLKSGRRMYRNVSIDVTEISDLKRLLMENEDYVKAFTALAEGAEIYYYDDEIKDLYEATWEAYKTEFKGLSVQEKLNLNLKNIYTGIMGYSRNGGNSSYRNVFNTLVYGEVGNRAYTQYITVSYDTPKTADYYMKTANDRVAGELDALLTRTLNLPEGVIFDVSFTAYRETGDGAVNMFYNSDMLEEEKAVSFEAMTDAQFTAFIQMVQRKDLADVSVLKPYMRLQFSFYGKNVDKNENYEAYIPISEADIDTFLEFVNQNRSEISQRN